MLNKRILRNSKDFSKIYNKGRSIADRFVVIFYIKNGLSYSRSAVLASKKVGNAVARNRARRLIKESIRNIEGFNVDGYDVIIIARNTINGRKYQEVEKSIRKAFSKTPMGKIRGTK